MNIGITCYPSIGGSGVLATSLGEELARRGHEVHFICSERPFRLSTDTPRLHFHPVQVSDYGLFKYRDYTLPLSVKMAEVARDHRLDVLHVHYAVPHATAALLARAMLPLANQPRIVTTLHGTDTTLLARDPAYGPAIQHALNQSDAVTAVSKFLAEETGRLLTLDRAVEVIPNFHVPHAPARSREDVRDDLGLPPNEALLLHASNLRPLKRIDLLLETFARLNPTDPGRLLILAGEDFSPYQDLVRRLGIADRLLIRDQVLETADYLQAADLILFTSESESFCLGILEGMFFGVPSVAMRVGGIPEVVIDGKTGLLTPFGDIEAMVAAVDLLLADPARRAEMGASARQRAGECFTATMIVSQYEALYRRLCR